MTPISQPFTSVFWEEKNGGVLWSHINHLMGYKDDNMVLDVYSGGFTIELFSESIGKLSYEEEIDNHLI